MVTSKNIKRGALKEIQLENICCTGYLVLSVLKATKGAEEKSGIFIDSFKNFILTKFLLINVIIKCANVAP